MKIAKYSATWCKPCAQVSKLIEKLLDGRDDVVLEMYDIDDDLDTCLEHGVKSVPTVIVEGTRLVGLSEISEKLPSYFKTG